MSHLAPVAAIAGIIHTKAKNSRDMGQNCWCLWMPPQWSTVTLSPCYRQGHRVHHDDNNSLSSQTTDLPPRGKSPFASSARVPVGTRLPNATPRSDMSHSILEAKGCAFLLNLSSNTLQCHPASSHREAASGCQKGVTVTPPEWPTPVLSSLKQCTWGTKLGKHYFSKSIKNKPSRYCKNTCSSNTCPHVQAKETHHNQP